MSTNLKTQLTKDEAKKQVTVIREFAAPVDRVWPAWTQPELLDQWWAPRPWTAETKSMDFRPGGTWYYSMVGPAGERHHCRADYSAIDPQHSYTALDAFCDGQGTVNPDFPRTNWHVVFEPSQTGTKVTVTMTFSTAEDMKKLLEMGFQEGFTMAHGNLDELLAK